jgi:hypothetical protein
MELKPESTSIPRDTENRKPDRRDVGKSKAKSSRGSTGVVFVLTQMIGGQGGGVEL